jgi:hypothetical protein
LSSALVLCVACGGGAEKKAADDGKKTEEAEGPIEEPRINEGSANPRENPLAKPDYGEPAALSFEPPIGDLQAKPGTRPFAMGWSKSGDEFGYCTGSGGDTCTVCQFLDRSGSLVDHTDCADGSKTPDAAKTKEIHDMISDRGYAIPDSQWNFKEVAIVWDVVPGDAAKHKATRLRVGGRVEVRVPVYSVNVSEEAFHQIWPEAIALSPEGDRIGILGHAYAAEGQLEAFQIHIVETGKLASQAYNGAGLLYGNKEQHDEAIDLYHKAAHAWAGQKWSMYNMACAMAQTGAPAVHAALVAAVDRGGAEVKTKMVKDHDLEMLWEEPWFKKLAQ